MDSLEIRQIFLDFFVNRGHSLQPSASLVPEDRSVLLTTAGMQPFKKYFLGEKAPFGSRATSCQKCFRTSDIDQVGDESHLTFLEMLGNFSFGDYFKEESMSWALELLTQHYQISTDRLYFTYFEGDHDLPSDEEARQIWIKKGIDPKKILPYGRKDNFWGPTGNAGPCGPTTEIHYDLTGQSCARGKDCRPGCNCGRFVELWNIVFNQYFQSENGQLKNLTQTGIDTGMGLERLTLAVQGKLSVFETDLFQPIFEKLSPDSKNNFRQNNFRILADHLRGSLFLVAERIEPSNLEKGYILRRIVRRLLESVSELNIPFEQLSSAINWIESYYGQFYPELIGSGKRLEIILADEKNRIERALEKGLSQINDNQEIDGKEAFRLYATYGLLPKELKKRGYQFNEQELVDAIERHKEISRRGANKKFGGHGLSESVSSEEQIAITKLHTATHLLQSALREVLGEQVAQKGSDINSERLRFDFSFDRSLDSSELERISDLVNRWIGQNLKIEKKQMKFEDASNGGALVVKNRDYPEEVDVYAIISGDGKIISKEVCAGPHVTSTGDLGIFRIIKEESSSAGVRRIKAILKNE